MSRPTYTKVKSFAKPDQIAGFGLRFGAYFIDILLILFVTWILFWFVFIMVNFILFQLVAYFLGFFYFFLLENFTNGQTLGKLIFGIKTVDLETSQPVSGLDNLLNCMLKCNLLSCLIDLIIGILYNYGEPEKRLRIMQNASHTLVIKTR